MNIVGVIPARMGSSRFPGKPLAEISGIAMIGHVYNRCSMATILSDIYVATCDREISDYISSIGGNSIMTSSKHERASDRTYEAMLKIEEILEEEVNIIVMIQGDEPMILPAMIDAAVKPLIDDTSIGVSNLMVKMVEKEEQEDPNEVKVVVNKNKCALYFSREAIPSSKKYSGESPCYKQICIIPFRRDFLIEFASLDPTPLEIIESVDMNRFLENDMRVKMVEVDNNTYAVDTPEDLKRINQLMKNDRLVTEYSYLQK